MITVVAIVGDLHCNSTLGLCPPRVALDDGGEYVAYVRGRLAVQTNTAIRQLR